AQPLEGGRLDSRVAASHRSLGVSAAPGAINQTGNVTDIALHQDRWLAVQAPDGGVAYTRAGNLQLTANGLLTTASGLPVLDQGGAPVAVPPNQSMLVGGDGTSSVVPLGPPPSPRP